MHERDQRALAHFLTGLATILMPRGVTPAKFKALADDAFIGAAADVSRLQNGRINQSRVAVLTGMRRGEIRRRLREADCRPESYRSPIEQAIAGWHEDQRYTNALGQPRRLSINGKGPSFANLVKRYVGDIPHRAVLAEMQKLGAIRQVGNKVEFVKTAGPKKKSGRVEMVRLMSILRDGVRAFEKAGSQDQALLKRLTLDANTLSELSLIRGRCTKNIDSLITALGASLQARPLPRSRSKRARYRCTLSILLTEDSMSDCAS